RGEPITLFEDRKKGIPALALVGDRDLVMAVVPDKKPAADLLEQVLKIRAGKRKGFLEGKLVQRTKEAPGNARTLVAYDLSEMAVAKVSRDLFPLPAPRELLVHLTL